MEKIQIQFNESDYRIYYEYCQKYYQVHNSARRQSIHVFHDLYIKGLIPLEKENLVPTRQLFSGKCDELKKDHASGGEGDAAVPLRIQLCSDILNFIDDLEKMFRLIQKRGIVADYLMILGTFSRVIEETKNAGGFVTYEIKDDQINSVAQPLADIIQQRVGSDAEWRLVLRELTTIAAKFNQRFSDTKFDLDIIKIVAPAVIAYFDNDVPSRIILPEVPIYFEECELEAFETLLNRTPDQKISEQETNWDIIFSKGTLVGPLKVIASTIAQQRAQWSNLNKPEHHLLVAPSHPVNPTFLRMNDHKTFDIAVNKDVFSDEESPPRIYPGTGTKSDNPKIPSYVPVIIGAVAILVFVIGIIIISGGGIVKNTTAKTTNITAQTTTIAISNTPVTPQPTPTQQTSNDIGLHLLDIAFGPENDVIKKPVNNLTLLSLSGNYNADDVLSLQNFIILFDSYSSTIRISENINHDSNADIQLDFLPAGSLNQINYDRLTSSIYRDRQNGTIYFIKTKDKTYINSDLKGDVRARWVLRALLYNMGFYGETGRHPESIFYSGTTNVTQLSTIDLKAMQIMYGKRITNGMTYPEVNYAVIP